MIEWLKLRDCDWHALGSKPTRAILLCPWKDTFPYLAIWASSSKLQLYLYKTKKTKIKIKFYRRAILCHLQDQIGIIAGSLYYCLRRFPVSQEDKYRDKMTMNK